YNGLLFEEGRYNYWFDWDGFDIFIIDTWSNMSILDTNAISKFIKKLRHLKLQTRLWVTNKKESATTKKAQLKGNFPKGGNSSFIALTPKMKDAKVVKDYRPISLIGSLYKIIAKILANRLVRVLGELVNEVQSAFIVNRQILDGPFILDELIHWCHTKKKETMIFKVDFEKAYDSIRWDYLDDVLNKIGFGSKWRNWIHNCLNSSKGSILVNGSPTGEFQFRKGLKQGDPLSLFMFLSIMESLRLSFQNLVNEGFGSSNEFTKSKLVGIFVEDEIVSRAASKMGCCNLMTHFLYLGVKVGGLMSRIKSWDEIEAKLHSFLSKWKMKTLSVENFFIGADVKEKKMSWFKCSRVLASKDKGGFIRAVHGNSEGIETHSRVSYSSTWLSIVNEVNKMRNKDLLKTLCLLNYALMKRHDYDITVFFTKRGITIMMVNTRTDADLLAAVQNALQTLLPQIRAEIREEFRTSFGPSDSGGNPSPVTIHTWLERFNKQK
nr:cysteine-rich receptor-like protein kinase [Tanacetum cinerariifolium]